MPLGVLRQPEALHHEWNRTHMHQTTQTTSCWPVLPDNDCELYIQIVIARRPTKLYLGWMMNGQVAENITFGAPRQPGRLARACTQACLDTDVGGWPAGLETLVGERGLTMSGGQQMRVALARAFYQAPALILADDPLAAVDPEVGAQLFSSLCAYAHTARQQQRQQGSHREVDDDDAGVTTSGAGVGEHGRLRSVVLALNQMHLVERCDRVLHMDAGRLVAQGTWAEVASAWPAFAALHQAGAGAAALSAAAPVSAGEVERVDEEQAVPAPTAAATAEVRLVGAVQHSILRRYLRSFGHAHFVLCCVAAVVRCASDTLACLRRYLATSWLTCQVIYCVVHGWRGACSWLGA